MRGKGLVLVTMVTSADTLQHDDVALSEDTASFIITILHLNKRNYTKIDSKISALHKE